MGALLFYYWNIVMKTPEKLADIIPFLFQHEHQWKYDLLRNWPTIFGNMSDKVHLESINKDILVLAVSDACLMQELYTLSPVLLTAINQVLDKPHIQHLRFKRAGLAKKKIVKNLEQRNTVLRSSIILTAQEERALQTIKDPQLAQAMKEFLIRCHCEQKMYAAPAQLTLKG
jgi:hypothetical protein